MKDLTHGSVVRHMLAMSAPVLAFMILQALYVVVSLYFVAGFGDAAIAGVSAAGNVALVISSLAQMLGVGTATLISHAAGRKDSADASRVFTQSIALSVLSGVLVLSADYALTPAYMRSLTADAATVAAGVDYLRWYMPGLALQFALSVVSSALRGAGIVRPTMIVYVLSLAINILLAPVLIAGWGTGHAMGAAGAGLTNSLAVGIGLALLWIYLYRRERYVAIDPHAMRPSWQQCKRILNIGLPAAGEMLSMFIHTAVIYWVIRDFGTAAQAGFGVGSRIMQTLFLPVMAISLASGPIIGQNFAAREGRRVKQTFRAAALTGSIIMLAITLLLQLRSASLVGIFTKEADVVAVGSFFLQVASLAFVGRGMIYTCSSLFQGLGNTRPILVSSAASVVIFAIPAIWLSTLPGFRIEHVWYLSIATVMLQAVISILLLQLEFKRRLEPAAGEGGRILFGDSH